MRVKVPVEFVVNVPDCLADDAEEAAKAAATQAASFLSFTEGDDMMQIFIIDQGTCWVRIGDDHG